MLNEVGLISHLVACAGYLLLAAAVLWRRETSGNAFWLALAALTTAAWAGTFVLAARFGGDYLALLSPMETLQTASWVAFLVALLRRSWHLDERLSSSFVIAAAIAFLTTFQLILDLGDSFFGLGLGDKPIVGLLFVISRMTVAICGLVLLHNLYVNSPPASRNSILMLCVGLAGIFGYQLNLYTLAFLQGGISPDLYNIRGAADALVVPLLLISSSAALSARIQVSRQVVFHTVSFTIIGVYLITMALVAYGLRMVGGDWGRLLQIVFIFATAVLGGLVLFSPRFRAALRVQIAKNFFAYKYDYRQEWLRFISTVSRTDAGLGHLPERVIQAVCAVVDSPGGVLYTPDDDGRFDVAGRWHFEALGGEAIEADSPLGRFLADRQRIILFDELRSGRGDYGGLSLPVWAVDRRVWLAIPLQHLERLAGILLLERSVAPRELNWEDFDLLRTLGQQAASYIAEASSQAALDDAVKFDEFNRRFAFIMHDIKNLVSQLSLVARNAERHADNPAFRSDMVATLQSSVGKMNDLLARLAQHNTGRPEENAPVDVAALVREVVDAKLAQHRALRLTVDAGRLEVEGDRARLEQLFTHLIQNAIDASKPGAPIRVNVRREGRNVRVEIADKGIGMSAAFLRNELFRPFRSTKAGGFGIGAYEAREIARGMGGRLDVISREGEGTVFTALLPALWTENERKRA